MNWELGSYNEIVGRFKSSFVQEQIMGIPKNAARVQEINKEGWEGIM